MQYSLYVLARGGWVPPAKSWFLPRFLPTCNLNFVVSFSLQLLPLDCSMGVLKHCNTALKCLSCPLLLKDLSRPMFAVTTAALPWNSRPVCYTGVSHCHWFHRPHLIPTTLSPTLLATYTHRITQAGDTIETVLTPSPLVRGEHGNLDTCW